MIGRALVWVFGGLAAVGTFVAVSSGSGKTDVSKYAQRLKDSHYRGVDRPTQGPQLTTWDAGSSVTSPSALEWVTREISLGRTIWHDSTLYGSGTFLLYSTPDSSHPAGGEWRILATSTDLPALNVASGGGIAEGGSEEKTPIDKPADLPRTTDEHQPQQQQQQQRGGPPVTGITDVDSALRSPDTSPATMHAIATSLRANGKAALADAIDDYANERYAQLRAAHTALGGTPWRVRPGDIPWDLEEYYTGTHAGGLADITRLNKGKPYSKWTVGSSWLLPLSWDVESKVPFTPKPTKPAKLSSTRVVESPHMPLPDTTAQHNQQVIDTTFDEPSV